MDSLEKENAESVSEDLLLIYTANHAEAAKRYLEITNRVLDDKTDFAEIGLRAALKYAPTLYIQTHRAPPLNLGTRWIDRITHSQRLLKERCGDKYDCLLQLAERALIYCITKTQSTYAVLLRPSGARKPSFKNFKPPKLDLSTVVHVRTWDIEAYISIEDNDLVSEIVKTSGLDESPHQGDFLVAVSLLLFQMALQLKEAENPDFVDVLFEVSESLAAARAYEAWDEAFENMRREAAEHGSLGKQKYNQKREQVITFVIEQYDSNKGWKSASHAAFHIFPKAVDFAKSISFSLAESNAQRTVHKWILAELKTRQPEKVTKSTV